MPAARRPALTYRSALAAVASAAGVLFAAWIALRASRVVSWVVIAAVVAGVMYPPVSWLARRTRRGLAAAAVFVASGGVVVGLVAASAADLAGELARLQAALPSAAARLERSAAFGGVARQLHLGDRAADLVGEAPTALVGGEGMEAVRSTANRGVGVLITVVLSVFFVLYGDRLLRGGLRQVAERTRRRALSTMLFRAYRRAWTHLAVTTVSSLGLGVLAWALFRAAELPGAVVLGVAVGLAAHVPYLGVALVGFPVAVLGGALRGSVTADVALGAGVTVLVLLSIVSARWIGRRSIDVGPFASLTALVIGAGVAGVDGALVALPLAVLGTALLDEGLPEPEDEPEVAATPNLP